MARVEGWQARLAAVANERRLMPYAYGVNDCWCFARAAVEAVTGEILLPQIVPPRGWIAAAKVMIDRGWADVGEMMTELVGLPVDPSVSRDGDVVSFEEGGELHLAVRVGDTALTPSLAGLVIVDRSRWLRVWKIG